MEQYRIPQYRGKAMLAVALFALAAASPALTAAQGNDSSTVCADYNAPAGINPKILTAGSTFNFRGTGYDFNTMTALGVYTEPFNEVFNPEVPSGYFNEVIDLMGRIYPGSNPDGNAEVLRSTNIVVGGNQIDNIFAGRHGSTGTTPFSFRCIDNSGTINLSLNTIAFSAKDSPYTALVLEEVVQMLAVRGSADNFNNDPRWREITGITTADQFIAAEEGSSFRFTMEMLQHGLIKHFIDPEWNGLSTSKYEIYINGVVYKDPLLAMDAYTNVINELLAPLSMQFTREQLMLYLANPEGNRVLNYYFNDLYAGSPFELVGGRRTNNGLIINGVSVADMQARRRPATATPMPSLTATSTLTPTAFPTLMVLPSSSPTVMSTPIVFNTVEAQLVVSPTTANTATQEPTMTETQVPTITLTFTPQATFTPSPTETATPVPEPIVSKEALEDLGNKVALILTLLGISGIALAGGTYVSMKRGHRHTPTNYKAPVRSIPPVKRQVRKVPPIKRIR